MTGAADADREQLAALVRELGVVHQRVTLSSGAEADYYVDLRRVTLEHRAAPLIGRLLRVLTADWEYAAVGGLTLGADPVADAVLHAAAAERAVDPDIPPVDAFVVRKATKQHGMQRLIEGPDIAGRHVLVVEDTSTTGSSVLTAVRAVLRRRRDGGRRGHRRRSGHRRARGDRSRGRPLSGPARAGRPRPGLIPPGHAG